MTRLVPQHIKTIFFFFTLSRLQARAGVDFNLQSSMASSKLQAMLNHPAGPKTIHFWAPTFKWGIIMANMADFSKPPEMLSYPHQAAVAGSGLIWTRYSTVIKPKNWNLIGVNFAMAVTGFYQLFRKLQHDNSSGAETAVAKE